MLNFTRSLPKKFFKITKTCHVLTAATNISGNVPFSSMCSRHGFTTLITVDFYMAQSHEVNLYDVTASTPTAAVTAAVTF